MTFNDEDKRLVRATLKARRTVEEGTRMDLFAIGYGASEVDAMPLSEVTIAKVVKQCLFSFFERDCECLPEGEKLMKQYFGD